MTLPHAILCDMDGTLVDTEPYWEDAKIGLATRYGIPFTAEDAAPLVGRSMMVTIEALQKAGVPLGEEEVLAALVDEVADRVSRGIPWLPGAQDFLSKPFDLDDAVALVEATLQRAKGTLATRLRALLAAADDVEDGDPELSDAQPDPDAEDD